MSIAAPPIFARANPFRIVPLLDEEYSYDDAFEAAVLRSIDRAGAIDLSPDAWGIHDGVGIYFDEYPTLSEAEKRSYRIAAKERQKAAAKCAAEAIRENEKRERAKRKRALALARGFRKKFKAFLDEPNGHTRTALLSCLVVITGKFKHCDQVLASAVAVDFMDTGWKDAERRGMPAMTWLWKRSRFMAGFK